MMMKRSILLGGVAALGLVLGACALCGAAEPQAGKVILEQRYTPGSLEMTLRADVSVYNKEGEKPAKTGKMSVTMVGGVTNSPPDAQGVRTMQMTVKRMAVSFSSGDKKTAYDSAAPAAGQDGDMAAAFKSLVDAKITIKIGPDGQVQSVADEMTDSLAKRDPQKAAQLKSTTGDSLIGSMTGISKIIGPFPAKPVGPGDEWPANPPDIGKLGVPFSQTCKFLKIENTPTGKIAVLQFKGATTSSKLTLTGKNGAEGSANIEVQQAGTVRFNVDLGRLEILTMDAYVAFDLVDEKGQNVKMDSKATMEMTLAKVVDSAAPLPPK
jgi:hypothetical protein